MRRFITVSMLAVAMSGLVTSASGANNDTCWQLVYRAIERSAAQAHAQYISYLLIADLDEDGRLVQHATASITYRDDGLASVDDDRWSYPFMSRVLDPGPPVLGPYDDRASWLDLDATGSYPLIADVHTRAQTLCEELGETVLYGTHVVHVAFPNAPMRHPALKEAWIDSETFDFVRVVVSEWLDFLRIDDGTQRRDLTDFTIDVMRVGSYSVLRKVTWTYTEKVYSQTSTLSATYDFGNYAFASKPPANTLFAAHERSH